MVKDIYTIMRNDIECVQHPDLYLEKINYSGRYFVDGGMVRKSSKNYCAYYTYDNGLEYQYRANTMVFKSFSNYAGKDLLDFIYSVLNADSEKFILTRNLEVFDLRTYLQHVKKLSVESTEVDDLFIQTLKKYFLNLESIKFIECHIKSECNFNLIKASMTFSKCEIDDIRSFNDTHANLNISESRINKISNATIYAKELEMHSNDITNYDLRTLFLKCNFPNLQSLNVSPSVYNAKYSYGDSFHYLGDSCKNLEYLIIRGKVSTFDFLLSLPNLNAWQINSIFDKAGAWHPDVDSKLESEKIRLRNLSKYQIIKTLTPTLDDRYIIGNLENQRIRNLLSTLQLISYTEEEKDFLLQHQNLIEYYKKDKITHEVDSYYKCSYDKLKYYKKVYDPIMCLGTGIGHYYRILYNMLYEYNPLYDEKNKMLLSKNFIYYIDGIPIIFEPRNKPVRTLDEAKKKMENEDDMARSYEEFLAMIEKEKENPGDIEFGYWKDRIGEVISTSFPYYKYLSDLGDGGKELKRLYDEYIRYEDCRVAARIKNEMYQKKMEKILKEAYDDFNIEEKKYILDYYKYYSIGHICDRSKLEEGPILKSINKKTGGEYKRISNYLKLSYNISCKESYNGVIQSSTFSKIDTTKAKEKILKKADE